MTRGQILNAIWIVLMLIILFTPLGFHVKVWVNRVLAFAPTPLAAQEREQLKAYDFSLRNIEGNMATFEDFTDEVVLLNYWATWCSPCIAEMPSMAKLYDDYGNQIKFVFLTNDDPAKVKEYLNKKEYDLPVYFENAKLPPKLGATNLPTTFIIDRNGYIVLKKVGAADWNNEKIRKLLDGLIAQ